MQPGTTQAFRPIQNLRVISCTPSASLALGSVSALLNLPRATLSELLERTPVLLPVPPGQDARRLRGFLMAVGLRVALRDEALQRRWHAFILRIPLVGRLARATNTARFASTLAILSKSGVPLVEALAIAAAVIANLRIRDKVIVAAQAVREGSSLTRALDASGEFPPMMLHMIASGEKSGELDQMLARTARNQENDLAAQVALLVGLFEPFMLVFMGAVVLVIVLAILLPILSLNQLVG